MAVTTKQWINADMHLFIYIKNGPVLHQRSALSSGRAHVRSDFLRDCFFKWRAR